MERKLSKTINSRKELLHCPPSVLNENNMLNIGLVKSNNINNGNIQQEYNSLTKEYSLENSAGGETRSTKPITENLTGSSQLYYDDGTLPPRK